MSRRTGRPPKLPLALRLWARAVYLGRHGTQCELAAFLGVSQPTIHRIVSA
jgi:hypothetical protein